MPDRRITTGRLSCVTSPPYGGTRAQVDRLRLASFLQQAECRQIPGRIHREPIAQGTARDAVIEIAQVMDRLATLI